MNRCWKIKLALIGVAVGLSLRADTVQACAACYGKSDSSLAQGMNWGIFALLAVVLTVLSGVVAFFIFIARRAATASEETPLSQPVESVSKV